LFWGKKIYIVKKKVSRKWILFFILVVIGVILYLWLTASVTIRTIPLDYCKKDSDCIKIASNPCETEPEIGGYIPCKMTSINEEFKDYWNGLLLDCENKEVECYNAGPGDDTLLMDPKCKDNRCILTKQRPFLVTPECGTATSTHDISFGWFPVDYKTKHIIQIDNNSDFSSPEIEEYATNSGSFKPKKPFEDGLYYWRVRVEYNEIWSDICSITFFSTDIQKGCEETCVANSLEYCNITQIVRTKHGLATNPWVDEEHHCWNESIGIKCNITC